MVSGFWFPKPSKTFGSSGKPRGRESQPRAHVGSGLVLAEAEAEVLAEHAPGGRYKGSPVNYRSPFKGPYRVV